MPSKARQKKIMEKLNRAQKCSILGPQNLGSGGARAPGAPPWIRTCKAMKTEHYNAKHRLTLFGVKRSFTCNLCSGVTVLQSKLTTSTKWSFLHNLYRQTADCRSADCIPCVLYIGQLVGACVQL